MLSFVCRRNVLSLKHNCRGVSHQAWNQLSKGVPDETLADPAESEALGPREQTQTLRRNAYDTRVLQGSKDTQIWDDPWKYVHDQLGRDCANSGNGDRFTGYRVSLDEWKSVERCLPLRFVPQVPDHTSYPTPSGWKPPKDPLPKLAYIVHRNRKHMLQICLELRREGINKETYEIDREEVVVIYNVDGIFQTFCKDLSDYCENVVGHPVATHFVELQHKVRVFGADRSIVERCILEMGF